MTVLLNAPADKLRLTGWVNVYPDGKCYSLFLSKEQADETGKHHPDRIACVKVDVEYTVGEGLDK